MIPSFYMYSKYRRYHTVNVWFYSTGLVRITIRNQSLGSKAPPIIEIKYENMSEAERDINAAFGL